jgi:NAD(P)-dependent dehydrogenase (short-subunit alcohol dehydrogenase family)
MTISADVTDAAAMQRVAAQTLDRYGAIDVLVSSAGIGRGPDATSPIARPVAQTPIAEWDAVIGTNLRGTFLSNRAVLPAMITRRSGQIVNVSSSRGGVRGQAFAAPYSASKFGIVGMSEALAEEVRRFNIRVQVVLPEVTDTPLLARTTIVSRFGALLQPQRVAAVIVDLIRQPEDALMIRPLIAPWTAVEAGV